MSDFSLTLVLQIKTSKIINDMAKVQQKSEIITAFGGIFFVLDKFDSILSSVIDSHLGLRSRLIGYQYSEIIRAVFSVFCCGGDCMEDLNLYLKDVLAERPHTRIPSADTVLKHKGTGTLCTRLKKRSFVHFFAEIFGGNGKNTYICTMKLKFNDIYGTQSKTNKWYWHLSCDA